MSSSKTSHSYDRRDRQNILDFILENNLYNELRAKNMWQRMEKEDVCPGRSWPALKDQFCKNIINSLDTLQINPSQKALLLNCYYKKYVAKKPVSDDNIDENEPPSKKRKYDCIMNNNDAFEDFEIKNDLKTTENNENETDKQNINELNIDENMSIINISSENIDELQVKNEPLVYCEEFSKLQINKDKEINEQRKTHEENVKQQSTSAVREFSEEEDVKIILYIKDNMDWTALTFTNHLYKGCENILTNRTSSSIKDRFENVILPKLYKYNVLDTNDIGLFYDRAGIDIPEEFVNILMNSENENNDDKSVTIISNKSDDIVVISDSNDTQNISEEMKMSGIEQNVSVISNTDNEDLEIDRKFSEFVIKEISVKQEEYRNKACDFRAEYLNGQLCFNFNDGKHVFIPESVSGEKYDSIVKDLIYKYSILFKNIHKVTEDKLKDLTKIKTLNEELDNKILQCLNTAEEKININFAPFSPTMQNSGVPSVFDVVKKYNKPDTSHLLVNSKFYRMMIDSEEINTNLNLTNQDTNSDNSFYLSNIPDMSPIISLANRCPNKKINLTKIMETTQPGIEDKIQIKEEINGENSLHEFINEPGTSVNVSEVRNEEFEETLITQSSICKPITNEISNLNENNIPNDNEQQKRIQQNKLKESLKTRSSSCEQINKISNLNDTSMSSDQLLDCSNLMDEENSFNLLEPPSQEINRKSNDRYTEDVIRLCTNDCSEELLSLNDKEKTDTDSHGCKSKQLLSDTKEETNICKNTENTSLKTIVHKNMLVSKRVKMVMEEKKSS